MVIVVLMALAVASALAISTADRLRRIDGGSGLNSADPAPWALATAQGSVSRRAVDGAATAVVERSLDDLFLAIADAEQHLVRGTGPESTASDLESAVADLATRDRALMDVIDGLTELGADGARADDDQLQRLRYGAVRAVYWLVPLRARAAAEEAASHGAASPDSQLQSSPSQGSPSQDGLSQDVIGRALSASCALLVSIDRATADFLADNLAAVLDGEFAGGVLAVGVLEDGEFVDGEFVDGELAIGELAIEAAPRLLDELLTLRVRHRERAAVIDRVLFALARRLDPKTRDALTRWLLADPSDTKAVTQGLIELFALGEPWLALDVARDTFERGGPSERHMVALAVAREAPIDLAVDFMVERARNLGHVPTVWFELGTRVGGLDELRLAYADLRVDEDSDPEARRLAVLGMTDCEAPELRSIALDDPDPDVRSQALLTLTARDGAGTTEDVDAILSVLDRTPSGSLSSLLWASQNALEANGGGAPHTKRLVNRLRSLVLDDLRTLGERQEVLEAIEAWIDPNERLWLWDVLGG